MIILKFHKINCPQYNFRGLISDLFSPREVSGFLFDHVRGNSTLTLDINKMRKSTYSKKVVSIEVLRVTIHYKSSIH